VNLRNYIRQLIEHGEVDLPVTAKYNAEQMFHDSQLDYVERTPVDSVELSNVVASKLRSLDDDHVPQIYKQIMDLIDNELNKNRDDSLLTNENVMGLKMTEKQLRSLIRAYLNEAAPKDTPLDQWDRSEDPHAGVDAEKWLAQHDTELANSAAKKYGAAVADAEEDDDLELDSEEDDDEVKPEKEKRKQINRDGESQVDLSTRGHASEIQHVQGMAQGKVFLGVAAERYLESLPPAERQGIFADYLQQLQDDELIDQDDAEFLKNQPPKSVLSLFEDQPEIQTFQQYFLKNHQNDPDFVDYVDDNYSKAAKAYGLELVKANGKLSFNQIRQMTSQNVKNFKK